MDPPNTNAETEKKESSTSPTELFSSAQYLGQAAMSGFNKETKVDKAKAAAAADDLLEAANQNGNIINYTFQSANIVNRWLKGMIN